MPIYSYRCESCGHQQDVLRKISDAPLEICTACGAASFRKQVTAAGFQLKGSGWYVTDFREAASKPGAAKPDQAPDSGAGSAVNEEGGNTGKDSAAGGKPGDKRAVKNAATDSAPRPAARDKSAGSGPTTAPASAPAAPGSAAAPAAGAK